MARLGHITGAILTHAFGMWLALMCPCASALEVVATFTLPQLPAVVDLNGPAPGTGYAATYRVGDGPLAIVDPARLTLTDPVQAFVASARVTITNPLDGAMELLSATTTVAITMSYAPGTGVLTLNGIDSLAHYQQVLRSLTYQDRATSPTMTPRLITVVVNDGQLDSLPADSTVTLVPNYQQPLSDAASGDPSHHCGLGGGFAVLLGLSMLMLIRIIAATATTPDGTTPPPPPCRHAVQPPSPPEDDGTVLGWSPYRNREGTSLVCAAPAQAGGSVMGNARAARAAPAAWSLHVHGPALLATCLASWAGSLTAADGGLMLEDAQRAALHHLLDPIIGFGIAAIPGATLASGDLAVHVATADGERVFHLSGLHAQRPDGSWLVLLVLPLPDRAGITIDTAALRPYDGRLGCAPDDQLDVLSTSLRSPEQRVGPAGMPRCAPVLVTLAELARAIADSAERRIPIALDPPARPGAPDDGPLISQLRIAIGWAPRTRDVRIGDSQQATGIALQDESSGLPAGLRMELGYAQSRAIGDSDWGWLWGIAVMDSHQRSAANDPAVRWGVFTGPITLDEAGIDVCVGCSSPTWLGMHAEAGPMAGIGMATIGDRALLTGSSSTSTTFSGHGMYYEYGLRASLVSVPVKHLVAAIGCTALASHASAHLRYPGHAGAVDETATIMTVGFAPFASLGWQF